MAKLLPIDELNMLHSYFDKIVTYPGADYTEDEIVDEVLDILIIAYTNGCFDVNATLNTDQRPNADDMHDSIYQKIAGKNFEERIREYVKDGDLDKVFRVADTESHRVYNDSVQKYATQTGKSVSKRWNTMLDDKVRETHDYLEGMTVPLNEKFFTFDGDSALYPGGFDNAENNVNCRCFIELVPN